MHTDQWDLTESPEINPFIYGPLNFDKGGQHYTRRENGLFNKGC